MGNHREVAQTERVADCLPKTQASANSEEDVVGATPARCRKVKKEECKLRIEAPVNGGRNYNGPKVSEIPCRVSSDLHEWRNDFPAVSSIGSVKLNSNREDAGFLRSDGKDPLHLYHSFALVFVTVCVE